MVSSSCKNIVNRGVGGDTMCNIVAERAELTQFIIKINLEYMYMYMKIKYEKICLFIFTLNHFVLIKNYK